MQTESRIRARKGPKSEGIVAGMWFFRSIELLPRPSFVGLAPTGAMLAVWTLFAGTGPRLFGAQVLPLWLALATYFALTYAARLPELLARGEVTRRARLTLHASVAATLLAIFAGVFVSDPWFLQLGWIVGWLGYTGLFVGLLVTAGPGDLALMPHRWATDHPFSREAMWIVAVRLAAVALLVSAVALHGTLTEWVYTISLGRIALYYLFEWITILFALTWRDRDS
ncbi:MAG TPA: hypothetical protein DIU07_14240 [Rhodobacteraceae bacterium]|nr:hypothetical protein [Paracoccaceae bacterium]